MLLFNGTISCHQDPLVPPSAIPTTCRIYQLININEGIRDTTTYYYNTFGLIEKSTYRKWENSQLSVNTEQSFVYTADYYLFSQVDRTTTRNASGNLTLQNKGYTYTYQDGRIQQVAIIDNSSNAKLGFREYTYEGDKLKAYTESNGNKGLIRRYTFDGAGKLTGYEEPGSGVINTILTNGKIVQRTYSDSSSVQYQYDAEGQLLKQILTSPTGRSQYSYSYDNKPYWNKTQLRLRGIPYPDIGEHIQLHNLVASTYSRYQNNILTGEQKLIYAHTYNKDGYSQGYGRNDGVRQINYYSNCL
ncbi:hypothetical protein HMF3257_00160 [Spirosoma telluris]|uniref:RHS repeat protein n=1 Tax=Spirosoma telluris TaxID=2183553 RepID=A0A327ND79_9BACT|nr:hypothetical protein HMF3257_00160 [Spirosoma telluris]